MTTKLYSVKEVCELTGLNRKKLYEYDRSGILKPTHKDAETGYKTYDADAVHRLQRIALLRNIGMSPYEIKQVMVDGIGDIGEILDKQIHQAKEVRQHADNIILVCSVLKQFSNENVGVDLFKASDVDCVAENIRKLMYE